MRHRVPWFLALMYVLTGCRVLETKVRTISGVPSPGGTKVALLYWEEPPGGALVDDSFLISIKANGDLTDAWEGGEVIWKAEEMPLYVLWVNDHSLEVLLSPGAKDMKTVRTPSGRISRRRGSAMALKVSDVVAARGMQESYFCSGIC